MAFLVSRVTARPLIRPHRAFGRTPVFRRTMGPPSPATGEGLTPSQRPREPIVAIALEPGEVPAPMREQFRQRRAVRPRREHSGAIGGADRAAGRDDDLAPTQLREHGAERGVGAEVAVDDDGALADAEP